MRALPHEIALVTRYGTRGGADAGGDQPAGAALTSGAVAHVAVADDPPGVADDPVVPHAPTSRASADRSGSRRRGPIDDRVSASVGTCRQGRMAAS